MLRPGTSRSSLDAYFTTAVPRRFPGLGAAESDDTGLCHNSGNGRGCRCLLFFVCSDSPRLCYGLLRGCLLPPSEVVELRTYCRHRASLVESCYQPVLHMH